MAEIVEFHPPDASGFVMTPTTEAIVSLLDASVTRSLD